MDIEEDYWALYDAKMGLCVYFKAEEGGAALLTFSENIAEDSELRFSHIPCFTEKDVTKICHAIPDLSPILVPMQGTSMIEVWMNSPQDFEQFAVHRYIKCDNSLVI